MAVDLTRKYPKLNTKYGNLDVSISFNIMNLIFEYILQENHKKKKDYYKDYCDIVGLSNKVYESYVNGKRYTKLIYDRENKEQYAFFVSKGIIKLEIDGITREQWSKYINICKKYQALHNRKGRDREHFSEDICNEAERKAKEIRDSYKEYKKQIYQKIGNMEMNETACDFYYKLLVELFNYDYAKKHRNMVDSWFRIIDKMSYENLYMLWEMEPKRFDELEEKLSNRIEEMKVIKKRE